MSIVLVRQDETLQKKLRIIFKPCSGADGCTTPVSDVDVSETVQQLQRVLKGVLSDIEQLEGQPEGECHIGGQFKQPPNLSNVGTLTGKLATIEALHRGQAEIHIPNHGRFATQYIP